MLLKKSSFFKMILAALLLTNVVGCKKSNINTPPNDITNQPNYQFKLPITSFITTPHLFINYIPQSSNSNQLAAYNLSIADQKTALTNNFYASNNGKGNALMNTYVASVDEIWGVRFDPSLNKTVLTRLSLKNKINTDVSIFPADKLVRKIIGVDEILKKIY